MQNFLTFRDSPIIPLRRSPYIYHFDILIYINYLAVDEPVAHPVVLLGPLRPRGVRQRGGELVGVVLQDPVLQRAPEMKILDEAMQPCRSWNSVKKLKYFICCFIDLFLFLVDISQTSYGIYFSFRCWIQLDHPAFEFNGFKVIPDDVRLIFGGTEWTFC